MEILITHLTRMQPGFICVAGIEPATGRHVRPVLVGARLSTVQLARHGGPFDMGAVVDLGVTSPADQPPETEDQRFEVWHARRLRYATPAEIWQAVRRPAKTSLGEIFGPALRPQGRGCAVDVGQGIASLGCLLPAERPRLFVETYAAKQNLRMRVTDGTLGGNLSVTDLRLFEDDHTTPRAAKVEEINRRIQSGVEVVLCVGLTRPFAPDGGTAYHWLQVNNLHLADDPGWRLE